MKVSVLWEILGLIKRFIFIICISFFCKADIVPEVALKEKSLFYQYPKVLIQTDSISEISTLYAFGKKFAPIVHAELRDGFRTPALNIAGVIDNELNNFPDEKLSFFVNFSTKITYSRFVFFRKVIGTCEATRKLSMSKYKKGNSLFIIFSLNMIDGDFLEKNYLILSFYYKKNHFFSRFYSEGTLTLIVKSDERVVKTIELYSYPKTPFYYIGLNEKLIAYWYYDF